GGSLGSGTNAKWVWYSGSCGGTYVGESTQANAAINVSPTATTTYYVRAEQTCGSVTEVTSCQAVTVNVNLGPGTLSYNGGPFAICLGNSFQALPSFVGATASSFSVFPALPAGLTLNNLTGEISGTALAPQAATTYTVTGLNNCAGVQASINISVLAGSPLFNITPSSIPPFCGIATPVVMGLSGSASSTSYQLYRNGVAIPGATVTGTGFAVAFPGTYNTAGTYTVKTISACPVQMNGQNEIIITPAPNAQISYPGGLNHCPTGIISPTITGSPTTGTFSFVAAVPGNILTINSTSGEINLAASDPGFYTIIYSVAAANGCGPHTSTITNFRVLNSPELFNVTGGGAFCSPGAGVPVGLSGSQTGVNYALYVGATLVTTIPGTGSAITFGNQTAAGSYTVVASLNPGPACPVTMGGNATVIANPAPAAIVITPTSNPTICQGAIIPLSVSGTPPQPTPDFISIPVTVNTSIPNNSATGLMSIANVSGIPLGATITRVAVTLNIDHPYAGDLLLNLKGPNGNVLNLVKELGGNGNNFTNTVLSSNAASNISTASGAPFTNTYLPHAQLGVSGSQLVPSNTSNTGTFGGLYGATSLSANGNWTISARDIEDHGFFFFPEAGNTFQNWTLRIEYTYVSNPANAVWTPVTGLFIDPAATVPYVANSSVSRVFAKPTTVGANPYQATITNAAGCSTIATRTVNVSQSPVINVIADYCSQPGKIIVKATSDIPVNNWVWGGGLGSGVIAGNTSTIEATRAGTLYVSAQSASNSCPTTASISVAQELVVNGDFEAGNTGFTSGYSYVSNTTANGLQPAGTYTVNNNPNFNHTNFWGTDHTTANGFGNFMLVNGASGPVVWSQTVTVLPNTVYYFSAYAVSLNNVLPYANLGFKVNGVQVGNNTGSLPEKDLTNNPGTWYRSYGTWPSGGATTALIEIIDLTSSAGGNDFGLDDISFGTLSTFLNLTSAAGTNIQTTLCVAKPITDIKYEVGGNGSAPIVTGLPAGLVTYWNGRDLTISGSPTVDGVFNYEVKAEVCNNTFLTKGGTITVAKATVAGTLPAIASACYQTGGTFAAPVGYVGGFTKWQSSPDQTTWTDITNTTATLTYPALSQATYYRYFVQNTAACDVVTSNVMKVGLRNLWTGQNSADWNTASNWSDGQLPTVAICPSVIIPNTMPGKPLPVLNGGTATIDNLRVEAGAVINIINDGVLRISGVIDNLNVSGGINASNGTIEMNGTTQTISGSMFVGKNIENLKVSGTTLNITGAPSDTLNILDCWQKYREPESFRNDVKYYRRTI
ncbi:MAG: hypothetical protein EOP51_18840, partial [Sphingobacteriales bacterium]